MKFRKIYQILILLLVGFSFHSCVEPFDFEAENQESILVVEATLTNEMKQQEVFLSRTFQFNEDGPVFEVSATVKIIDDMQNEFIFEEESPGKYISTIAFNAEPDREYRLSITTKDNKYTSTSMSLTAATQIDELYSLPTVNADGVEGISIFVDTYNPEGTSLYYKYRYEETYKIIAPSWGKNDLILDSNNPTEFLIVPRTKEERTCFRTNISNEIIVTRTDGLSEDRLVKFPIHFINKRDYSTSHRYSILVKQYVQSKEAFTFYETLKRFSLSEGSSLFSQVQPGFFEGNIFAESNSEEKVIGFFDVSAVASKRIFFKYRDFFVNDPLPPYFSECSRNTYSISEVGEIRNAIMSGNRLFLLKFSLAGTVIGYEFVNKECTDCTIYGSNIVPDFWQD